MRIEPRQTWDEFCAEQDRELARENAAILAYKQQMREQHKPILPGWKAVVLATLLVTGAAIWLLKLIIDAVIP